MNEQVLDEEGVPVGVSVLDAGFLHFLTERLMLPQGITVGIDFETFSQVWWEYREAGGNDCEPRLW